MISSTDFRTGLTIEIDGGVWQVVEFQHVKPGKGAAFVRTKIKNVETGAVVERTFNPNEKMPAARLDTRKMQYLYEADGMYTFMDTENYEQTELSKDQLGDALNYLEDGMSCEVEFYDGKAIAVELPTTVVREITWTEPGVKGDTSGKVLKPAKIATGFEVAVPLFVNQGDKIEIDTRTGEYRKRV